MKMKKLLSAMMVGAMVMTTVPMVSLATTSTAYAAKGGAKLGGGSVKAPSAAPKASAPSSDSNSKSVSGNGENYKPSKDAKSLNKDAPSASSKTNSAANTQSGSRWGSALRNIGLFAGGMFLGSMLSHLFGGFGGGMMADVMGLIMNVLMLGVAFMVIRWLWNKFKGRNNGQNAYRSNMQDMNQRQEPIDVTPRQDNTQRMPIHDIKGPSDGYDAKSEADKYRNR